jgi:hypothetical protein
MAGNFFRSLRRTTRTADNINQVSTLITSLRNASSFDLSLHNMFRNADFTLDPSMKRLRINDSIDISEADRLLRRGELRAFARQSNNAMPSTRAESGFRTSITNTTPDLKIRQLDEAIDNARRGHADIDITPNPNQSFDQFRNSLSTQQRTKIDGILQKVKALAGTTLIVGGVIVIFIVGADLLENLWSATLNRRGCFQVSAVGNGGRVTSCRVLSRTCLVPRDQVCDANFQGALNPNAFFPTNVPLVLQRAFVDAELAGQIKTALGQPEATFNIDFIQQIMNSTSMFSVVANLHLESKVFIANPCIDMSNAFPGTETVLCRACNPSLEVTNPGFIDLSAEENDTMSFMCVPSSSILDTIVDIGIGNGVDLLSPFGRISDSGSGTFILYTLLLVLLIIVAAVVFSLIRKKKD